MEFESLRKELNAVKSQPGNSLAQVARKTGFSRVYVSQVAGGHLDPSPKFVESFRTSVLGEVSISQLADSTSAAISKEVAARLQAAASFLGRDTQELADELINDGLDKLREKTVATRKEERKRLQIVLDDEVEMVEMGGVSIKKSDLEAAFEFAEKQAGIHGKIPSSK